LRKEGGRKDSIQPEVQITFENPNLLHVQRECDGRLEKYT
jgi:hypothetical protein